MSQLIVALDCQDASQVWALVDQFDPALCALKVGSELFTRTGPPLVRLLVDRGFRVFLDLKFHDIPNTVAKACTAAADLGVWMLNVHAAGGLNMLTAARDALVGYGVERPYLIAVTVLTSFAPADLSAIGVTVPLLDQVTALASLAQQVGLDGVVCSAWEVSHLKSVCGSGFLTVTPGIRLPDDAVDDQARVVTPEAGIAAGSDFLVIGRSITRAVDPSAVIKALILSYNLTKVC